MIDETRIRLEANALISRVLSDALEFGIDPEANKVLLKLGVKLGMVEGIQMLTNILADACRQNRETDA